MIQKEEIVTRRTQIAEIRHADSVFRDIVARENEREDYEKRWFWELLQNAKDSVDKKETVKVKIEISDKEISFSHTGNPFDLDEILSLIIQGSSKNNKEGKTGRFGTGFMSTYLLSKEVQITGALTNDQGCFDFLLNRNASNNEDFFVRQKESNDHFDNSIRESSYLGNSEFQTRFSYVLDEKGKPTAKIGLQCLDELIPITQLFNDQIESVTVIENGSTKTFTKSYIKSYENEKSVINEWEIGTVINDSKTKTFRAYICQNTKYDSCIITHVVNDKETVFPLTLNYPRLYFTFPLIGTEEIGIPIIINSTNFEPRIERDGVYLNKSTESTHETDNKEIVQNALENCLHSFATLFSSKDIGGLYELFSFKLSKDYKWIDHQWFNEVKNEVISQLATKPVIGFDENENLKTSLTNLIIPYSNSINNRKLIWNLLISIKDFKVPLFHELEPWVVTVENIAKLKFQDGIPYNFDYVWGIEEVIDFIEETGEQQAIKNVIISDVDPWLNQFYSSIIEISNRFPLDKKIVLNQEDNLRIGEGMFWDNCEDDNLISISKLTKLNFANNLIARSIERLGIFGIDKFTKLDAINSLMGYLNNLSEIDFSNPDLTKCNAQFLKWLIHQNQKETIRELKVLTGATKNEETFNFDHFPRTDHLLLPPKSFFENQFPLYAGLIMGKNCLNDVYNEHLGQEEYKYLDDNGFIYISPLVIKNELATIRTLEYLVLNERDLNLLRDDEGQLKYKFSITSSDFAYLTATDGNIYSRNTSQKSSLDRFRFLLLEAVEKDAFFVDDKQEIFFEGLEKPITLRKCLWVNRAKKLSWIFFKSIGENGESKFSKETPSSKNLSELLKGDDTLIREIRGSKQQLLLNKLGVGVSDLIRNTLSSDELRISWDKAITNMITSNVDPELVQEIFNDPNIKKEYERRLNERKLILRNQFIGKLIEDLFNEYINQLRTKGASINIKREPFGSDYIITDESSDLVNGNNEREGFKIGDWLVELKATGKDHAAMTPLQAKTAAEYKTNYALIVVPLDGCNPDIEYIRRSAKVIETIGYKIDGVIPEFNDVEFKKATLNIGKEGISVNIQDEKIRFRVSSEIWQTGQSTIESFISTNFAKNTTAETL